MTTVHFWVSCVASSDIYQCAHTCHLKFCALYFSFKFDIISFISFSSFSYVFFLCVCRIQEVTSKYSIMKLLLLVAFWKSQVLYVNVLSPFLFWLLYMVHSIGPTLLFFPSVYPVSQCHSGRVCPFLCDFVVFAKDKRVDVVVFIWLHWLICLSLCRY